MTEKPKETPHWTSAHRREDAQEAPSHNGAQHHKTKTRPHAVDIDGANHHRTRAATNDQIHTPQHNNTSVPAPALDEKHECTGHTSKIDREHHKQEALDQRGTREEARVAEGTRTDADLAPAKSHHAIKPGQHIEDTTDGQREKNPAGDAAQKNGEQPAPIDASGKNAENHRAPTGGPKEPSQPDAIPQIMQPSKIDTRDHATMVDVQKRKYTPSEQKITPTLRREDYEISPLSISTNCRSNSHTPPARPNTPVQIKAPKTAPRQPMTESPATAPKAATPTPTTTSSTRTGKTES
ncbi:hypothetical protein SAMN02745178_00018 [Gemmiger formicilis]|uniref:Uncharacterized protein n=1 Tax=Gemmiger formicilis TaxID=745368 RepID=A0A1T4W6H5_9FIRM|nr:hypothetical protein [Gemmiger formicilis]SKA72853.1 hypothetical protein SAMN02745178_00018 [Gemmiger formicilis]